MQRSEQCGWQRWPDQQRARQLSPRSVTTEARAILV